MEKERPEHRQNEQDAHNAQHPTQKSAMSLHEIYPVRIEPTKEDEKRYFDEQYYRWRQIKIAKRLNLITVGAAGAALVAAAVGLFGLGYLRRQLNITKDQLNNMNDALLLQRQIAAAQNGGARIAIDGVGVYHDENGISATIRLLNEGNKFDAEHIQIFARIGFGQSCPTDAPSSDQAYENATVLLPDKTGQHYTTLTTLPHFTSRKPAFATNPHDVTLKPVSGMTGTEVYVWSVIKYTDYWKLTLTDGFCSKVPYDMLKKSASGYKGGCWIGRDGTPNCPPSGH